MDKKFKYTKPNTFLLIALLLVFLFIVSTAIILPGLETKMQILKQKNITKVINIQLKSEKSLKMMRM